MLTLGTLNIACTSTLVMLALPFISFEIQENKTLAMSSSIPPDMDLRWGNPMIGEACASWDLFPALFSSEQDSGSADSMNKMR